jgi:hypothetical protein
MEACVEAHHLDVNVDRAVPEPDIGNPRRIIVADGNIASEAMSRQRLDNRQSNLF